MKSFIKETIARIKGDEETVIAERNYRKVTHGVKSEIQSLESKKVDKEIDIEDQEIKIKDLKFRDCYVVNVKGYLRDLDEANEVLGGYQEELDQIKTTIKARQSLLKEFEKEVK